MDNDTLYNLLMVVCLAWSLSRIVKFIALSSEMSKIQEHTRLKEKERRKRIDELYGR